MLVDVIQMPTEGEKIPPEQLKEVAAMGVASKFAPRRRSVQPAPAALPWRCRGVGDA